MRIQFQSSRDMVYVNAMARRQIIKQVVEATPQNVLSRGRGLGGPDLLGLNRKDEDANLLSHFRGWVYASVRHTANRMAAQPIHVARIVSKSGGEVSLKPGMRKELSKERLPEWLKSMDVEIEPFESHPILDLINNPNELMTQWQMMFVSVAHLEATARSYWWLRTNKANETMSLWPISPAWITAVGSDTAIIDHWRMQMPGSMRRAKLNLDEVGYFSYPDPADPILGALSPLEAVIRSVKADEYIQESHSRTFQQGLFPTHGIVMGDIVDPQGGPPRRPRLTEDQEREIVQVFKERYQSVFRQGEPLVLDSRIKEIIDLTRKPAEMGYLDSSKETKARITQMFGKNPIMLGEVVGANRASAAIADEHDCSQINPKLTLMSQVLTRWLGPKFAAEGEKLIVFFEPCRPSDREQRRQDYLGGMQNGAVLRNEYRQNILDLPIIPGGDDVLLPVNIVQIPADGQTSPAAADVDPAEDDDDKSNGVMAKGHDPSLSNGRTPRFFVLRGNHQKTSSP